jgi:hypothetical protein
MHPSKEFLLIIIIWKIFKDNCDNIIDGNNYFIKWTFNYQFLALHVFFFHFLFFFYVSKFFVFVPFTLFHYSTSFIVYNLLRKKICKIKTSIIIMIIIILLEIIVENGSCTFTSTFLQSFRYYIVVIGLGMDH